VGAKIKKVFIFAKHFELLLCLIQNLINCSKIFAVHYNFNVSLLMIYKRWILSVTKFFTNVLKSSLSKNIGQKSIRTSQW
jgi:hypothetical protein